MAAIDDLNGIARAAGYESMWQAKEAITVSDIDPNFITELNDAICQYALTSINNPQDLRKALGDVEYLFKTSHVGKPGLADRVIANWRNPVRPRK